MPKKMSAIRDRSVSTQPPKKPAIMPIEPAEERDAERDEDADQDRGAGAVDVRA